MLDWSRDVVCLGNQKSPTAGLAGAVGALVGVIADASGALLSLVPICDNSHSDTLICYAHS
jgi:hypothetical protein